MVGTKLNSPFYVYIHLLEYIELQYLLRHPHRRGVAERSLASSSGCCYSKLVGCEGLQLVHHMLNDIILTLCSFDLLLPH